MWKRLKIIIACGGTVVVTAIIVAVCLILFGMEDKIEFFFYIHFTIGAILVFVIFWPIYSKKLK